MKTIVYVLIIYTSSIVKYSISYLLKCKNDVTIYLKEYIYETEEEQNLKVSKIRCYNEGKYANTHFRQWCKNKGIVLDFSTPHTSQLNGKAGRLKNPFRKSSSRKS